MKDNPTSSPVRSRVLWLVIISTATLLIVAAVWAAALRSRKMTSAGSSGPHQLSEMTPGTKVKVVLEIEAASPEGSMAGKLLERQSDEDYARTKIPIQVQSNAHTSVVMGKQSDIQPGAVVYVTGTIQQDRSVAADQVVMLTGYVRVK